MHPARNRDRPYVRVDANGCWNWVRHCNVGGYGRIGWKSKDWAAHRLFYQLAVGPIPEGLHLDHLCRNRRCVNPAHLEPVTMRENIARGIGAAATACRTNHCKHGHEFSEENTVKVPGGRACRKCMRQIERRYRQRRKAKASGLQASGEGSK